MHQMSAFVIFAVVAFAESMPQFALRDTDGAVHHQDEWAKAKAVVLFFSTTDCPLSNGYIPEMNRIREAYANRGVAFYAVQTDTTIAEAEVRQHAKDFAISFPVLIDPRQTLVRRAGATATPEVAVLSNRGQVLYLGRIDNRIEGLDKRRTVVTERNLRDALDAVLAAQPIIRSRTTAVGCSINFVKEGTKR
jgi:peroxiredoxin